MPLKSECSKIKVKLFLFGQGKEHSPPGNLLQKSCNGTKHSSCHYYCKIIKVYPFFFPYCSGILGQILPQAEPTFMPPWRLSTLYPQNTPCCCRSDPVTVFPAPFIMVHILSSNKPLSAQLEQLKFLGLDPEPNWGASAKYTSLLPLVITSFPCNLWLYNT